MTMHLLAVNVLFAATGSRARTMANKWLIMHEILSNSDLDSWEHFMRALGFTVIELTLRCT